MVYRRPITHRAGETDLITSKNLVAII